MATRRRFFLALTACSSRWSSVPVIWRALHQRNRSLRRRRLRSPCQPTRTPASTSGVPTTVPVTQPTSLPTFLFPTAIIVVPTRFFSDQRAAASLPDQHTAAGEHRHPVARTGNIVAGNVQILGSAIHPQFLQYQVEFGPDPNPGNLWFPATIAVTTPVLNGLLGIWNTTTVQDSRYQLRLRVYLRDGTLLTTVINNITVQNRINTPVPSATPNIPRPIAAFTQDKASGDVPLTVQFINQSSGTINTVRWNFGDGNSSPKSTQAHIRRAGSVYRHADGQWSRRHHRTCRARSMSPARPLRSPAFTQDRTAGVAPLTVQFTDQSTGRINAYLWIFSDGTIQHRAQPNTHIQRAWYIQCLLDCDRTRRFIECDPPNHSHEFRASNSNIYSNTNTVGNPDSRNPDTSTAGVLCR